MFRKRSIVILLSYFFTACVSDSAEPALTCENLAVRYSRDIVPIINTHCATAGCHDAGSVTGDFTAYTGLKNKVDNGSFQLRVLDLKIMPPLTQNPLSEKELKQLQCWVNAGALE